LQFISECQHDELRYVAKVVDFRQKLVGMANSPHEGLQSDIPH